VRQPLREMGRIAARVLLERINNPERGNEQFVIVDPELIVRDSTGPAPVTKVETKRRKVK
jgi:DNA-binding LacI/PurR family transcriptional regulator